MAIPLLDTLDLKDKDITADALLTQRKLADYLVLKHHAHYHFTVKANQSTLLDDLMLFFQDRQDPHFVTHDSPDHGRIETRRIWTTIALNGYLDFPHVAQAFAIDRDDGGRGDQRLQQNPDDAVQGQTGCAEGI